jgi:hypothetical protein
VFVDKRELVTLMTLGACPELLVLGYLLQPAPDRPGAEVESITVDWEVGAAAVKTRAGVADLEARTAHRVVTTGCGQGTVFGDMMSQLGSVRLPDAARPASARARCTACSRDAPAGQHPPQGRLGARLRAVPGRRDADVRGGRRPPQRHRHHRRLDGPARRARRRQDLLHHRPPDQRDGDEGGPDGCADHRLAQWRHAMGHELASGWA